MKIVYALQDLVDSNHSIFLAGPTPRNKDVKSWRSDALKILLEAGYNGVVYIPEPESGVWSDNYNHQIEWEWEALNKAVCVLFWVPREIKTMPAFTTNVEFGMFYDSGKIVLGYPIGAPKMKYLDYHARRCGAIVSHTLEDTLRSAMDLK
jgi:hypothetical protein